MNLIERVYAVTPGGVNITPANPSGSDIPTLITNAITRVILPIAAAIAVVYLIYSGILYLTAAGNPDAAKKGQQGVVNAIIGIIVIVLAYVIVSVVGRSAQQIS